MKKKCNVKDLSDSFRKSRNQCLITPTDEPQNKPENSNFSKGYNSLPKGRSKSKYDQFLSKYMSLELYVDSFNSNDLMYFFREKANENGVKYVIANMKRDLGIFKHALSNYSPKELCLMIEFIFCSNQNYLDKNITQPTVLTSGWCNTIYRDSIMWANDEYVPRNSKSNNTRDWVRTNTDSNSAKVGDWE